MEEKAIISGPYQMNWETGNLELKQPGAPLQRGQKVYAIGAGCSMQNFAVINPDTRELVEVGTPDEVDEYSLGRYFFPLTRGDKYMKPISQKFGIGLYYAENEPLYSDEDIAQFLLRADKMKQLRQQLDEQKANKSKSETERLKREYDYLTIVSYRWDYKTTSGNLRKVLAHKFPGVKFSVSRRSNGSNSVTICWTDGPTDKAVNQIGKLFQGLTFDGMTDYEDSVDSEFLTLFGALGYVFTEREFSPMVMEAEKSRVLEDYPQLAGDEQVHYSKITSFKHAKDAQVIWFNVASVARHRLWDVDLTPDPEVKHKSRSKTTTPKPKTIPAEPSSGLRLVDYSEKAVAVVGDTKAVKELLKSMGGRFNSHLSCGAGWIFIKKNVDELKAALGL